jgi:uncharacterized protein (DUF924 family)
MTVEVANDIASIEQVLEFWFADTGTGRKAIERRLRVWFGGGAEFDRSCADRFSATLAAAAEGRLDDWQTSPRGSLALIVVLDQFSRNIYRGTASAFRQDARALAVCREGIERGRDKELSLIERVFFYMPMQHAEDRDMQALSVRHFEALAAEAPESLRDLLEDNAGYARQHRDIVERFGRFPHRNEVLGRRNTADEEAYLANDAPHFGQ